MSFDVAVTASVQITPRVAQVTPGPSIGPFPFGLVLADVPQPETLGSRVTPLDLFSGTPKTINIPTHLRRALPTDPGKQAFFLIKTDLPVTVRVRDDAAIPVEFERRLEAGGSIMIVGGGPDVDRVQLASAASPYANVSVWVGARA